MSRDPWVDDYVALAKPFAQPLLVHIRDLVHRHCPQVEEAKKWSFPNFLYRGKMMCSMAAFNEHVAFSFAHGELVVPDRSRAREAMGSFGRITQMADLPDEFEIAEMITTAMVLIESGIKRAPANRGPKAEAIIPPALAAALAENPAAKSVFDGFAPSHRRDYIEWITDAKRDETRDKRIAQTIIWLVEGKRRNWKYENC